MIREFTTASTIKLLLRKWICPALFTFYTISVFVPWVPRSWRPPCNNSWALVLHDAFVKRAAFGTDVVFTFGPYGFLCFLDASALAPGSDSRESGKRSETKSNRFVDSVN